MVGSLSWASLNWLLDAASLWCFIAAFGSFTNPVGLFAAYGIANVLGAIPITPAGLGVIDSVTPVLLVSFGLTRSVATLGVLAWRLVNFWLPIPTGIASFISLKVPRGSNWATMRRALADMFGHDRSGGEMTPGQAAAAGGRRRTARGARALRGGCLRDRRTRTTPGTTPDRPRAHGPGGHRRGSLTTDTKNSSICRTAAMNCSTSTGLVT